GLRELVVRPVVGEEPGRRRLLAAQHRVHEPAAQVGPRVPELHGCRLAQSCSSTIVAFHAPRGAATSTVSPTRFPITAAPSGQVGEAVSAPPSGDRSTPIPAPPSVPTPLLLP